jgi:hypothetical protein
LAVYVPQISHLTRARCSAGTSRLAFGVWLLASLLTTTRAIAIHAGVFMVLGGIQIVATALIMLCAARYKDTLCPIHVPGQSTAKTAAETATPGTEPGSWRPASRSIAASAAPAEPGGALRAYAPVLHPNSDPATARSGREPDVQTARSWPKLPIAAAVPRTDGAWPGKRAVHRLSSHTSRRRHECISVCYRVQVADGTGTGHLQSLVLQDTVSGTRRSVPADALFVLIGAQPRTDWLARPSPATGAGSSSPARTCSLATAGHPAARRCH